jgi:hypothetical protein
MVLPHWEYFLSIESDLARCTRFVEFVPENYDSYSVEFARIIMASASEFDTLAKSFCKLIEPTKKPKSINKYQPIIILKYPRFVEYEIEIPRYKLKFKPWENWSSTDAPDWWTNGYNKIKHNRTSYFKNANLKNALLSTTGLMVGILYFYKEKYGEAPTMSLSQSPTLLEPKNYDPSDNAEIGFSYNFPA